MSRVLRVALAIATTLLGLAASGHPVAAQALPAAPADGLSQFVADPGQFMTALFNAVLVGLGHNTTTDAVEFMNWLLANSNVISQTPPGLSYDSEVVRRLWSALRLVGNAALAIVTAVGGLNLIVHPHIRAPYHGALELVPRVLLGGILVNTSLDWGRFAIDVNNALCQALGPGGMPGWGSIVQPAAGAALLNVIAVAVYLLMGLLLLTQMLMRLALVDVLLILAPLALLCWVLPQTYGWARLWFNAFFASVFVQFIQVLVLQVGAELIQRLPGLVPGAAAQPIEGGRAWLVTLLLGVAVLQLARRIPRLMPGYPHVGSPGMTLPGLNARRLVSLVAASRGGSAAR